MNCSMKEAELTAYVLGELDESARAGVEAHLAGCRACRLAVEDIRATAEVLTRELAAEPAVELTARHRRAIDHASGRAPRAARRIRLFHWLTGSVAAAAILAMTFVTFFPTARRTEKGPGWPVSLLTRGDFDDAAAKDRVFAERDFAGNEKGKKKWDEHTRRSTAGVKDTLLADEAGSSRDSLASRPPGLTVTGDIAPPAPSEPLLTLPRTTPVKPGTKGREAAVASTATVTHRLDQSYARIGGRLTVGDGRSLEKSAEAGARRLRGDRVPAGDSYGGSHEAQPGFNTEAYDRIVENPFLDVLNNPLSTFSIDVDTASYSNVRRFLNGGQLPPRGAVRIEELVNYFHYDYPSPGEELPFSAGIEVAGCPWELKHRLVRIGLQGRRIHADKRPVSNLVFLLDVSGSMRDRNKLPLVTEAMKMLVAQLIENDRVAITVYAGAAGLVLDSTTGDQKEIIIGALDRLQAGGSTAGGAGIQLAYKVAVDHFIEGGVNRVILCTDGDFNVGVTDDGELVRLIEQKATSGVFLTVLGFGRGNYKDAKMEKLADKGNGNYAYIDNLNEARKVLVEQMSGTLVTIAKDVKIQVEFNPKQVAAYRLIGYENRMLRKEDFNDDAKDAGEIGAGHSVTALYEVVPSDAPLPPTTQPEVDALKYQAPAKLTEAAGSGEMLTLKLRYKAPDGATSSLLQFPAPDNGARYSDASKDFKFAASVAAVGMVLRDSKYKGTASFDLALELAGEGKGADRNGYRAEFIELIKKAKQLSGK